MSAFLRIPWPSIIEACPSIPYLADFLKKFLNLFLVAVAIIAPYFQLEEQVEKSFLSTMICPIPVQQHHARNENSAS